MNYQIGGHHGQTGYDNSLFGAAGFGADAAGGAGQNGLGGKGNSILEKNSVGDLLACRLVQGGKEPVLDINGIRIKTKAAKEFDQAKPGDTVYLKIQQADKNQVSLKIVGTAAAETAGASGVAAGAQVMQGTEQFSDMIKENLDGVQDEEEAKENQKEILRNLSADEIAKLRMMQIDVTNATLSDLIGMVVTIRSGEHQDEINEDLADIVRETLGKLRRSLSPSEVKTESGTETVQEAADTSSAATAYPAGRSRLNSEGYIVTAPVEAGGAAGNPVDANAQNNGGSQSGATKVHITDEQMIFMVKNNMEPTIENLDIAKNSVNEDSPSHTIPFNERVWNDIYPQVVGIIESAGMSVTEQSLGGAKFMLRHELPITVGSLRLYMGINSLNQRGLKEEQIEENINEQISLGNAPEQARITGSTLQDRAKHLVEKVQAISLRSVDAAVSQGKPLTISYLYNSSLRSVDMRRARGPVSTGVEGASLSLSGMAQAKEGADGAGIPYSTNPAAVAARRQIEEIRLSMTIEAANRLVRQDIHIDARPLSQIVEELRKQENSYYEKVVSAHDLHDLPEDVDLLKETLKETEGLKTLPEYALGEVVKTPSVTVGGLYETAVHIKAALAGNAYETMMTRPRQDMGDSIREAFRNVDDILKDLDLDRNEENQRAVRILAYNEMELTENNIISVKAADAKVQQMFETLTPQIVLNLIRENKNPLNMTIDGLNEEIMQQKEIMGVTDEQRFSEFLYQMDRSNAISEEERKSFIGIYRLLDKVEKSHGKDIGAVVRNGQEITLNNLFSADKSRRARGMDVAVDEHFGERIDVETEGESILSQIQTAYNQTLVSGVLRHIRPETLKSMENLDYRNMPFEELNAIMKAGDNGQGQAELNERLSAELTEALAYEEDVATMLEANEMPETATNILAAHQVMYGEDGIYGMIRNIKQSLPREKRENITERENRILETLESRDDVIYGMEYIRAGLSEAVHDKEIDGTITAMDIQSLKYLNAGMPIAMRAVEQEVFQVPLVVGEEVSIMKVSIIQDGSKAGEINASADTKKYGRLEAFIHVEGSQIEGYVVTEEESGQRKLEANELTLRSVFAKAGMEVRDLRLDGTKPVQYGSGLERESVPTSKLYRAAKQLLTAIKLTGITADN
ncbi:MAG: DUF6240 domain-containing protein [Bacteroidales bacterium]|nr:DUF6240 domain-containing protein [Clostridium sp.]MCM1203804.1 DUF6240 domain-containing protein [Bacteroidales bacterium]